MRPKLSDRYILRRFICTINSPDLSQFKDKRGKQEIVTECDLIPHLPYDRNRHFTKNLLNSREINLQTSEVENCIFHIFHT